MRLLLLTIALLLVGCTKSENVAKQIRTPQCPPFVYKHDTGKVCGWARKRVVGAYQIGVTSLSTGTFIISVSTEI